MTETTSATSLAAVAYQAFQAAQPETVPSLVSEFSTLVAAANDVNVQPHVRVYALNVIGQHGASFDKSVVKSALEAIVTLLGEENETKAPHKLIVAAIDAFVAMCTASASKQDDLVRVAADLCVIIILNKNGFPQTAVDAAEKGLAQLTAASVVGVAKKYLHLLSDEREKDEDEQLEKERAFAIARLQKIMSDKTVVDQWTEEAQTQMQSFLAAVVPTAQKNELEVLCASFSKLSSFGDGTFIVDKLLKAKTDSQRLTESLVVVAPFVPRTVVHDAIAERLVALTKGADSTTAASSAAAATPAPKKGGKKSKGDSTISTPEASSASDKIDIATDTTAAIAFLLAAHTASAEMSTAVADALLEALDRAIPAIVVSPTSDDTDNTATGEATPTPTVEGDLPENISAVEAIIMGIAIVAVKNNAYVSEKLVANESLIARLNQTYKAIGHYKKIVTFAVKKAEVDGTPSAEERRSAALALTALTNLSTLIGPLTTKHLPTTTIVPSWEKVLPLPRVAGKKSARESILSSLLPNASPLRAAATAAPEKILDSALPTKKSRHEAGRKINNNNNRSGKSSHVRGGKRF